MENGVETFGDRHSSGRRRHRRPSGDTPRVVGIRRKPRNQGAFGWFRKSVYNQKSPLITLLILLAGLGVTAVLMKLLTSSAPTLPEGLRNAQSETTGAAGTSGATEAPGTNP